MPAGLCDFAKALRQLFGIFDIRTGNGRKPNDGIHRRADIVGHIGKKLRLGAVGILRSPIGFFQRLAGFDLGLFLLRNIHARPKDLDGLGAVPFQRNEGRNFVGVFVQRAVFKFVDVVLL